MSECGQRNIKCATRARQVARAILFTIIASVWAVAAGDDTRLALNAQFTRKKLLVLKVASRVPSRDSASEIRGCDAEVAGFRSLD